MPLNTVLEIVGIELGDYSVRGLIMQLEPEDAGELARAVDGTLLDFTLEQFRKYRATISCTDHEAPEMTGVWRGKVITVTALPQLGVSDATDGSLTMEMMVESWSTERDEYGAQTGWTLELREI